MDRLMVVRVGLKLQAVERDALFADGNFGQVRPDLSFKAVFVHAQEPRCVPDSDQPGINHLGYPSGDFRSREAR